MDQVHKKRWFHCCLSAQVEDTLEIRIIDLAAASGTSDLAFLQTKDVVDFCAELPSLKKSFLSVTTVVNIFEFFDGALGKLKPCGKFCRNFQRCARKGYVCSARNSQLLEV